MRPIQTVTCHFAVFALLMLGKASLWSQESVKVTDILSKHKGMQHVPTLDSLRQENDYNAYYAFLIKTMDQAAAAYCCEDIYDLMPYFDWTPDETQKEIHRKALVFLAYFLRSCAQPILENIQILQLAHQYAEDEFYLDKSAWYCEFQMAHHYARLNHYEKAIYYYRKVIPGLEKREEWERLGRLYGDLANGYKWSGHIKQMKQCLEQGLEYAALSPDRRTPCALNARLAHFYINDEYEADKALFYMHQFYKVLLLLDDSDSMLEERWATYLELKGDMAEIEEKRDSCIYFYHKALEKLNMKYTGQESRERAKLHQKIAVIHLKKNDLTSAEKEILLGLQNLNRKIPNIVHSEKPLPLENTYVDLYHTSARLHLLLFQKNRDKESLLIAQKLIGLSLRLNSRIENTLSLRGDIIQSKKTHHNLLETAMEIAFPLWERNQLSRAQIETLFDQSKANYLLLAQAKMAQIEALPDSLKRRVHALRDSIFQYSQLRGDLNEQITFELSETLHQILAIKDTLTPSNHDLPYFLDYFKGQKHYYLFTNIHSGAFFQVGQTSTIDSLCQILKRQVTRLKTEDKLKSTARSLYSEILPKNLALPKVCGIIGDGPLAQIPFDVLVKNGRYLVFDHDFYYPPHRRFSHPTDEKTSRGKVICLAPNYPKESGPTLAQATRGESTDLPFAEDEILALQESHPGVPLELIQNIDPEKLPEALKDCALFHFVGHATYVQDTAALILSDHNGDLYRMTQADLQNMSLHLPNVLLSACETGMGKFEAGEGVSSLTRTLMEVAGTQNAIYTLWSVNDATTATIVSSMYEKNPAFDEISLGRVKRQFLEFCTPGHRHPYYWAGINQTFFTSNKYNISWKLLILIFILLVLYASYKSWA